jgi:hypothetical protein
MKNYALKMPDGEYYKTYYRHHYIYPTLRGLKSSIVGLWPESLRKAAGLPPKVPGDWNDWSVNWKKMRAFVKSLSDEQYWELLAKDGYILETYEITAIKGN